MNLSHPNDPPTPAEPVPPRDSELVARSVPEVSPGRERFIRTVAAIAWLYGLYWIGWRWIETINWQHAAFSVTLAAAETYGLISSLFLILTVWKLQRREVPPAPAGRKVDVFITCYDEPLQLIRRTAVGARAIRYPHKTWILDDGKRDEVKAMARELGIGYIRRKGNAHAKAGNLNHALKVTRGEFVLQLDADHVPLPNILDRLLGYFDDPKVAFVQSPQDFYNTDSFTHVVNDEGRRLWEENRIFFSLIQPGKDRLNAAFFCGSCGVIRRTALQEIGGFSTRTITEDMETSIVLHGRGWTSVYHGETLAYGLAPASAGQYHVQRLRWGQGSMQILRRMNPLTYPGLTAAQRMAYFSSVITYLDGFQKAVFYLAPILFFLTGWLPVDVPNEELLVRLVPFLVLTIGSFELLSRGSGWILISERYNMTKFFTYMLAVTGYFTRKPLKFNVTPKGAGDVPFKTYAPQLAVAGLSVASLAWAALASRQGWIDYRGAGWTSAAFAVNGFWVCWNLYFALYVVWQSVQSRQLREDHRFVDSFPIQVRVLDAAGALLRERPGLTRDLNTGGISFRTAEPLAIGSRVEVPLALTSGDVVVRGEVTRVTPVLRRFGTVHEHGLRLDDLDLASRDAIELHCTQHAVPLWRRQYRESLDVFSHAFERLSDYRTSRRRLVNLPAIVRACLPEDAECDLGLALLEETSDTGARLVMENPLPPGTRIDFHVPGTPLKGRGRVVASRALESPLHVRFAIGIATDRAPSRLALFFGRAPAPPTPAAARG